jgi:hypothetical protein
LPVRDIQITQPFGANFLDFYAQWGLKGHPGIDFRAKCGCRIIAAHEGIVSWSGRGKDGGIGVEIWDKEKCFKTFYYHHKENSKKIHKGIKVSAGEVIALADNTGKYTTGDHEHFELYFVDEDGNTLNKNNGYGGSVDPAPYFEKEYGRHWDKPAAYHRYGRKQEWLAEFNMRFKNIWLHKQLKKVKQLHKIYDNEFINAMVYGGWDFDSVINPAMCELWKHLKKSEYENGRKPFE